MSTQNEGGDVKGRDDHEGIRPAKGDAGSTGAAGAPGATAGNQQTDMPPSETDDDQYDQGTVKRTR
jgi:hypothetical protein